jgi:hypothetical protein
MEANYRNWDNQHSLLRQLLEKDKDYPQALETFLSHHAAVHAAKLCPREHWSFPDQVLNGLSDEQMRWIPSGHEHSVVWVIWHIARIEDVTMNILLADSPQVFHSGNWRDKLESPYQKCGE